MADLAMPEGSPTNGLPTDIRDLLQAVHDAMDLPLAATIRDAAARNHLAETRGTFARIVLASVLRDDDLRLTPKDAAEQLRQWTAQAPVTYVLHHNEQAPR